MALPKIRPSNEVVVGAYMADSGTASSVYLVAPVKGYVRRLYTVLQGTVVGTADNVFTAYIGATAINHDSWKQLTSGSAVGDVAVAECSGANYVNEGDMIRVASAGAGSNTTPTMVYAVIESH